jgi:pyridoxine/pyridoxamine 5'-phosphate oxidase
MTANVIWDAPEGRKTTKVAEGAAQVLAAINTLGPTERFVLLTHADEDGLKVAIPIAKIDWISDIPPE